MLPMSDYLLFFVLFVRVFRLNKRAKLKTMIKKVKEKYDEN